MIKLTYLIREITNVGLPNIFPNSEEKYKILKSNFENNPHGGTNFKTRHYMGIDYFYRCWLISDEEEWQFESVWIDLNDITEKAKSYKLEPEDEALLIKTWTGFYYLYGPGDQIKQEEYTDELLDKLNGEIIVRFIKYIANRELFNISESLWYSVLFSKDWEDYMKNNLQDDIKEFVRYNRKK